MINRQTQINFEKEKIYLNSFEGMKIQTHEIPKLNIQFFFSSNEMEINK